jgi:MoaA/NifB/PqqE/SkfB family radical SAM enzyme
MHWASSLYTLIQNAAKKSLIKSRDISWENAAVFEAVFFEVVNKCNSHCSFCSASVQNDTRERKEMSFELYDKLIEQLVQMRYTGRVAFHVANDPLVFAGLEHFVAHARAKLPQCWIQIMTNGIGLTPKRGEALIESGIDELYINFYRTSRQQKLYPNVAKFIAEVLERRFPRKKGAVYTSSDGKSRLQFTLSPRLVEEVLWSRAGTSPNKRCDNARAQGFCLYPWTQLNISTDGLVSKCCADICFADPMGDLAKSAIADVWNGEAFTHIRKQLLSDDRRSLQGCRACDYFGIPTSAITNPILKLIKYNMFAKY